MKGVYQHCGEKHLHRYVAEFDFRYNNRSALGIEDAARATKALQGDRRQAANLSSINQPSAIAAGGSSLFRDFLGVDRRR